MSRIEKISTTLSPERCAVGVVPAEAPTPAPPLAPAPVEVGGRDGPDPTRYGDWELRGRCIDF